MDTVVSGRKEAGGVLVLIERSKRLPYTETKFNLFKICCYCTHSYHKAKLTAIVRQSPNLIFKSVTTDNGCEFTDAAQLEEIFKSKVFFTHVYASYEKGSVENCNRILRRWLKGTDFSTVSKKDLAACTIRLFPFTSKSKIRT